MPVPVLNVPVILDFLTKTTPKGGNVDGSEVRRRRARNKRARAARKAGRR